MLLRILKFHGNTVLQGGKGGSGASLLKKADASVEEQAKDMEKKVHEILEQSALLTQKEEHAMGKDINKDQGDICRTSKTYRERGKKHI